LPVNKPLSIWFSRASPRRSLDRAAQKRKMQARLEMTRLTAEMIATVVLAKGRRTTRGYFKCCCPAHDDQRPSLLIFVRADGRLSFRCFAGCPTRRIRMALRQRGVDLSRVKKQTVSEMQDGRLPARFLPEHPPNAQGNLLVR
jgi:hypothetical protein